MTDKPELKEVTEDPEESKSSVPEPEYIDEGVKNNTSEESNQESEDFDEPEERKIGMFQFREKKNKECDLVAGDFDGKQCHVTDINKGNQRIFGLKEKHSINPITKVDKVTFDLKYIDEKGFRQKLPTDQETAEAWYNLNLENQNLKDPIYKGKYNIYHFKKHIL